MIMINETFGGILLIGQNKRIDMQFIPFIQLTRLQ